MNKDFMEMEADQKLVNDSIDAMEEKLDTSTKYIVMKLSEKIGS